MNNLKVSNYLHVEQVDNGIYIGWNRFFPSIFILNTFALEILEAIRQGKTLEAGDEVDLFLRELRKYKFTYMEEEDPSREDFLNMVRQRLEELERRTKEFYERKEDYAVLRIVNDVCNLNCSYCVNYYRHSRESRMGTRMASDKKSRMRLRMIDTCIDQFFSRKTGNGGTPVSIFFNGGEILMDWDVIKHIVRRISRKYPGLKVEYEINTNMTLLTEEIASFFLRHNFKVNISIDGYGDSHDKTRVYPNGKGSFADVIKKVELYRKITHTDLPKSFQGTIEDPEHFQPEEVYNMENYGFSRARLAPNLLDASAEEARAKAKLMGKFLELNTRHRFQVEELIFTKARQKINQDSYRFDFNCRGLSGMPKMAFEINITNLSVSHLCGFIHDAAVPFKGLGQDIYNPDLWRVSFGFIKRRVETVLENCMACPMVGLCAGGCILSGIDSHNRMNEAACAYQQEIWRLYIKKAYHDRKRN